jgi:hypothetical protein
MPTYTYNASDWTSAGYTVVNYSSCSSAANYLRSLPTGNILVRVTPSCTLDLSGTITLKGNVGVVSDGGMDDQSTMTVNTSGGTFNFFMFLGYAGGSCTVTGQSDVSFSSSVNTLLWTPCTLNLQSNAWGTGQIIAKQVTFQSDLNFGGFVQMLPPGVAWAGFRESLVYMREVLPS